MNNNIYNKYTVMNCELIIYPSNIHLGETILFICVGGGWGGVDFIHILNDHILLKTLFQTLFTLSVNFNSYKKFYNVTRAFQKT